MKKIVSMMCLVVMGFAYNLYPSNNTFMKITIKDEKINPSTFVKVYKKFICSFDEWKKYIEKENKYVEVNIIQGKFKIKYTIKNCQIEDE